MGIDLDFMCAFECFVSGLEKLVLFSFGRDVAQVAFIVGGSYPESAVRVWKKPLFVVIELLR